MQRLISDGGGAMVGHKRQGGISMTGFLMALVVVGFVLFIGMKLFPMYNQYFSVKKALKGVATDGISDPGAIRTSLAKRFDVGYVDVIKPSDVKIERTGNGVQITADYEVRKPLIYNLDVVGKFNATETVGPGVD